MTTVDLKGVGKMIDRIAGKVQGAGLKAAYSTALRLVGVIQNEIIPAEKPEPVFDGAFRAAWEAAKADFGAIVFNTLPYASAIDKGVRGENVKIGRKMIAALTEWVRRKGLVSRKLAAPVGRRRLKSAAQYRDECAQAAWAIAMSMKKRGIFNRNGKHGLDITGKAAKRAPDLFKEELARELSK